MSDALKDVICNITEEIDEDAAVDRNRQDSTHDPVVFMIWEMVERAEQNAKALSPIHKNGIEKKGGDGKDGFKLRRQLKGGYP